jgi:hypothetical protein
MGVTIIFKIVLEVHIVELITLFICCYDRM